MDPWPEMGGEVWRELGRSAPESVMVEGIELRKGSRLRLNPHPGRDIFDLALAGRVAILDGIEQDMEDNLHLAVVVEDDPGREFGETRQPGHRFFFSPDEVEPLAEAEAEPPASRRVLVAGIGNVFLGDDGFGVEVVSRLAERALPPGVDVVDFGIRGMDLVYALQEGYEAAIFVDAVPRGKPPGTVTLIEPELQEGEVTIDTHGMDPVKVLGLARELGGIPARTLVVGCEPETVIDADDPDAMVMELSEPVSAAIDEAVRLVASLLEELTAAKEERPGGTEPSPGQTADRTG